MISTGASKLELDSYEATDSTVYSFTFFVGTFETKSKSDNFVRPPEHEIIHKTNPYCATIVGICYYGHRFESPVKHVYRIAD